MEDQRKQNHESDSDRKPTLLNLRIDLPDLPHPAKITQSYSLSAYAILFVFLTVAIVLYNHVENSAKMIFGTGGTVVCVFGLSKIESLPKKWRFPMFVLIFLFMAYLASKTMAAFIKYGQERESNQFLVIPMFQTNYQMTYQTNVVLVDEDSAASETITTNYISTNFASTNYIFLKSDE